MTLAELLTQCKNNSSNTPIRVFVGCMTVFNGKVSKMSVAEWVKLHPYFNCKVLGRQMMRNTLVVTL